jgi:hypothetical protein
MVVVRVVTSREPEADIDVSEELIASIFRVPERYNSEDIFIAVKTTDFILKINEWITWKWEDFL